MLFFRALLMLVTYDVLCTFSTFGRIHKMVKRWSVARRLPDDDAINRVCAAVNYACIWYPKQVLCLQCAFVTTYLLRRKGVPAHMVLGAQKLPFKAHAWVEVDGRVVNDKPYTPEMYAVLDRC